VSDVFAFTVDPSNTPRWIEHLVSEQCSEIPQQIGTVYTNTDSTGNVGEYVVSAFEPNKLFELVSKDGNYHVRYTYTDSADGAVMEYFEWMDQGELSGPFEQSVLEKLKDVMESVST